MRQATYCLSIAGLDPSGGAGILSDVKTFEAMGVQGFGVSTATTYQNEHTFNGLTWLDFEEIEKQLNPLFEAYEINYVKIGLIENWETLQKTIAYLKGKNENVFIAWDPILSASSGFQFHKENHLNSAEKILESIDLFTPNVDEMAKLFPANSRDEMGNKLSMHCSVLLKGGHNQSKDADDILYQNGDAKTIHGERLPSDKHGTGCVLSSAIIAHLTKGITLEESCRLAKDHVNNFLMSNTSLLGSHSHHHEETYS